MEKAGGQYIMSRFIICRLQFVKYFRGDQNGVVHVSDITEKTNNGRK
jgi:hypothetical protein